MNTSSKVILREFDSNIGLDRGASKLKEGLWYLTKVLLFTNFIPYPYSLKAFLLRIFGAKVGSNVIIKPRVNIHMPWKLLIADDVWIGEEAFLLNFEPMVIGSNVCISQRAFLCGGNHDYRDPAMGYRNGKIVLNDGVWIGAGCFVGPNVIIGVDSVITAGSIVSSSLPSNGVYKGNPAVFIKFRWRE